MQVLGSVSAFSINYRLFPLCIGAAFENKRRVDPLVSILLLESDIL